MENYAKMFIRILYIRQQTSPYIYMILYPNCILDSVKLFQKLLKL